MSRGSLPAPHRTHAAPQQSDGEPLYVEVGLPDAHRALAPLEQGHPVYGLFAWARAVQDRWSQDEHKSFWLATIDLWPRVGRQAPTAETLGFAFDQLRARGLNPTDAAKRLGYAPGSIERMRRRGGREWADSWGGRYVLPRVYTLDDPEVDPMAYPNFEPGELPGDLRQPEIVARLASIIDAA